MVRYLQEQLFSTEYLSQIVPLVKERVEKSEDFIRYADFFFAGDVTVSAEHYLIKGIDDRKKIIETYEALIEKIEQLRPFDHDRLDSALRAFCLENDIKSKDLFMPLRFMVTGKKATPPLFETMAVLGRERCRTRMRAALQALKVFTPTLGESHGN
jgi:glutamyl-tRNA synthetase